MTAPTPLRFTVRRSEWLRGTGSGFLSDDGKRCCLGFLGLACGLTDGEMEGEARPADIGEPFPDSLYEDDDDDRISTAAARQLMDYNDIRGITDAEREAKLTELFAGIGIHVTFED